MHAVFAFCLNSCTLVWSDTCAGTHVIGWHRGEDAGTTSTAAAAATEIPEGIAIRSYIDISQSVLY